MPPIDQDYIFENMRQRRMLSLISRGQFFGTPVKGGIRRNSLQSTVEDIVKYEDDSTARYEDNEIILYES